MRGEDQLKVRADSAKPKFPYRKKHEDLLFI
jgi:hypothetical protein